VKRYFTGNGVKRDWQRGEKWLKRGANTGNEMMMLQLGKHLLKGTYVIPRIEDGLLWLEKAALKNTHCLQELIRFYIDSPREIQDINRGLELLHRWIETGQKQAMYELGRRYLRGNGLPQNLEEGEKWLEKAAYAGLSQAMNDLGNGYLDGEYLPKNSDKGIAWLEQAAEEGDTSAMYSLGKRYLFGMGLPRNIERGLFWINKAAEMGNGSAIQVLKMGLINRLR
jgi:TPR repeat protein